MEPASFFSVPDIVWSRVEGRLGGRGKDPLAAGEELARKRRAQMGGGERRRQVVGERETRTPGRKSSTLFIRSRFGLEGSRGPNKDKQDYG